MDAKEFGQWLRDARKARKTSAEKVAELLDVTPPAVYNWESGKSEPDPMRYADIETAYGVPAGSIAAKLGVAETGPSLAPWRAKLEEINARMQSVFEEYEAMVEMMRSAGAVGGAASEVQNATIRSRTPKGKDTRDRGRDTGT